MKPKFSLTVFILLFISTNVFGQIYEAIEKGAANVFLINRNNSGSLVECKNLKAVLYSDINNSDLEKIYKASSEDFDSLRNHFALFESESENITVDSSLFLFNQWYLHLSNTFYEYQKEKFFSSPKIKILLFSASMSCYCTLEMCKNQTIDILKFIKENNEEYDYWIIDSYENNELQIEYNALFAPAVIVFDSKNEVLKKIEYEENMIDQLKYFLEGEI